MKRSKPSTARPVSGVAKKKLTRARVGAQAQNVAVMFPQFSTRVPARPTLGRDNLTFDAVTLNTNNLVASSDGAVAVSGSGYVTANASAHVLNQVPQGTSSTTRVGRKIQMTKLRLKGTIFIGVGNPVACVVRLALVYIPKLDRTTTTMAPHNVIWTAQQPNAGRVLNNSDRFRIIREWVHVVMGSAAAPSTGKEAIAFDEMVDINRHTAWLAANTSGTFDDMEAGALCLYAQSTQTAVSPGPTIAYSSRLYYNEGQ